MILYYILIIIILIFLYFSYKKYMENFGGIILPGFNVEGQYYSNINEINKNKSSISCPILTYKDKTTTNLNFFPKSYFYDNKLTFNKGSFNDPYYCLEQLYKYINNINTSSSQQDIIKKCIQSNCLSNIKLDTDPNALYSTSIFFNDKDNLNLLINLPFNNIQFFV